MKKKFESFKNLFKQSQNDVTEEIELKLIKLTETVIEDHFKKLPKEMLVAVFAELSPAELCNLATVCKEFKGVSEADQLWNRFLKDEKPSNQTTINILKTLNVKSKNIYKILRELESKEKLPKNHPGSLLSFMRTETDNYFFTNMKDIKKKNSNFYHPMPWSFTISPNKVNVGNILESFDYSKFIEDKTLEQRISELTKKISGAADDVSIIFKKSPAYTNFFKGAQQQGKESQFRKDVQKLLDKYKINPNCKNINLTNPKDEDRDDQNHNIKQFVA